MGMAAYLRRISPWLLEQLKSEQSLVEPFLLVGFRAEIEASPHQVPSNLKNEPFFMEMTQDMENMIRALAPENADKIMREASGPVLSLDKNWQEIHEILTGQSKPSGDLLSNAIFGGAEIGSDLGYGPARFLTPDKVKQISDRLASVSEEHFRASARSFSHGDEEATDFYCKLFTRLQTFYLKGAESDCPILLSFA
jgi:hypothetical protein